ncbi:YdcF family protein [Rhizobium ruizarguesonis]|uniref:YdcF family protein n=1 Tax=Rhizobium ruizarguesonis TaxID=2081791 RepID=UPI00103169D6|nr:YdcF family protein [Rhizobium ruizarguesonis]QND21950.1 YdcF family protein [Rhizobium leguminosarum bv. viciae]TAU50756.1 YdcF family protein [Rhizobium ruizarguesonis]TAU65828.1 YdcF family protein [Rhizobium ruizarguesonis]
MFLISKLVWIFAQPLSLAFLLVFFALIAGLLNWRILHILSTFGAALILFVTLYTTAGNLLMQDLEERFARPAADPDNLQCMIVLGGAFENEVNTARHGIEFNGGADRFVEALRLAQKFPQSRILVSGGDGSMSGIYEGDAAASERFFPLFGVGRDRLIEETQSRTTFENAVNTKEFLASQGLSNCLLITSGFHMPRSVGIFRKLGIDIVPWPTDYRTDGKVTPGLDFTQPSLNAQNMATAIREWYGLVGYYLAGRTSELYPQ